MFPAHAGMILARAKAASRVSGEQGMAEAVQMMAEKGVHAYAYTRKDGTVVRVPADVGIRRAMREQMRQASSRQALDLAGSTGHDLVYIDETPACRDSHKPINGKAFSVTGATPGYERLTPELEALMRDYGCQHRARLYWPGVTKTPEPQWRARGYTDEEMRELQTEQRTLENAVRKAKRSSEAVKAALAEAEKVHDAEKAAALSRQLTIANAKVRARQARVAEHVAAHPGVLTRQPWREALYDSARGMERMRKTERGITRKRNLYSAGKVDAKLVRSREYRKAFKSEMIPEPAQSAVADMAAEILTRCSGTKLECLAIISAETGEVLAKQTGGQAGYEVTHGDEMSAAIDSHRDEGVIAIHNHPTNVPPTGSDFCTSGHCGYKAGVVVLHDGGVFVYKHGDKPFAPYAFDRKVRSRISSGMSEFDATISVLEDFERDYGITWEKLR